MENCLKKPKTITLLNETRYLSYIAPSPDGQGHNHQALIDDGKSPQHVYASFYPRATHPKSLVNEISAYLIAKSLNLPVADRAFIVPVSAGYLQSFDPRLNFLDPAEQCPLWCVSAIPGENPKFIYRISNAHISQVFRADLAKWKRILDVVVFDEWLGNKDRNAGNLIRTGKHQYALIDHEYIAGDNRWNACTLSPDDDIFNKLAYILWNDYHGPNTNQTNHMIQFAERPLPANIHVLQELVYWWKLLLAEPEMHALNRFIMTRAATCQERIKQRYGSLL